jgi:hypothetical protein
MTKIIGHLCAAAAIILVLGVPFLLSGKFALLMGQDYDMLSSATVIIDSPSGDYVVVINSDMHPKAENLETWTKFFGGEEISYIFEDISCVCASGDVGGIEMARAFQSRLPENQMKIKVEDGILMISKAEYGRFDVIVMSKEFAEAYAASTLSDNENNVIIRLRSDSE